MRIAWVDAGRHRRNSGYGHASRVLLSALLQEDGVEVVLIGPLPDWEDEHALDPQIAALPMQASPKGCDIAIQVCSAEGARDLGLPTALYTFLDVSGPTVPQEAVMRQKTFLIAPNTKTLQAYADKDIPACLFQPNIDMQLFKPQPRWRAEGQRELSFIFVGTHSYRKGTDLLLEAFCDTFKRLDAHLHIHIPGTSPDALFNIIIGHGVRTRRAHNITVSSNYLTMPWLSRFYARADCYITCTRGEGWGIPAMEAMAAGLPVIGPSVGGMTDFLDPETVFEVEGEMRPVSSIEGRFGEQFHKKYTDANALEYFEPSKASIMRQLRTVAKARGEALRERGAQGRKYLEKTFTPAHTKRQAQAVLTMIRDHLKAG